jgi:plastocyanin
LTGAQIPDSSQIENTTDPEICGRVQQTRDLVVDRDDRGIAHVIVALRGVPPEKVPAAQPDHLVLDNRNCQFVPHVAVLSVGSTIETVNHDAVLHTVHFYGALERNVALPNESATTTVTVSEPGMIAVLCDVHGWMKAFIRVDSHPFHAVTDAEGTFVIEGIPAGVYELDAWHERLGSQSVSVGIEPGAIAEVEIIYALPDR